MTLILGKTTANRVVSYWLSILAGGPRQVLYFSSLFHRRDPARNNRKQSNCGKKAPVLPSVISSIPNWIAVFPVVDSL
jgi:hypothetical protein